MANRGHVILKNLDDDGVVKWTKYYIAYNANYDFTWPIIESQPGDCVRQVKYCKTGVSTFDKDSYRLVLEYHDYKDLDVHKHANIDYDSLDEALLSCVHPNIYIWDDVKWSYRLISEEVKIANSPPPRVKRNVWRERRQAKDVPKTPPSE